MCRPHTAPLTFQEASGPGRGSKGGRGERKEKGPGQEEAHTLFTGKEEEDGNPPGTVESCGAGTGWRVQPQSTGCHRAPALCSVELSIRAKPPCSWAEGKSRLFAA